MDQQNGILENGKKILEKIDTGIDNILNYDTVYSILIILFLILIAFPDLLDMFNNVLPNAFKISNLLPKLLFILCILYFSKKDLRIAILLILILLIMIEKQQTRDINDKLINLMIEDTKNNKSINELEQRINTSSVKYLILLKEEFLNLIFYGSI
jgi:hypothetical protein